MDHPQTVLVEAQKKNRMGLEFGHVSILSHSRFSVLSEENKDGEVTLVEPEVEEQSVSDREALTVSDSVLQVEENVEVETVHETENAIEAVEGKDAKKNRMGSSVITRKVGTSLYDNHCQEILKTIINFLRKPLLKRLRMQILVF